MQTFKRICVRDYTIYTGSGQGATSLTLRCGEEYLTSAARDGVVTVFSAFWVNVPVSLFADEREFTPSDSAGAGVPPDHRIIQIVPWRDALMALTSRGEIYRLMEPLETMPTNQLIARLAFPGLPNP